MGRRYLPLIGVISVIVISFFTPKIFAQASPTGSAEKPVVKPEKKTEEPKIIKPFTNPEVGRNVFKRQDQADEGDTRKNQSMIGPLWTMVLSVMVVLGLIGLLYYLFKKFSPTIPRVRSGKAIQFLARRYLDTRNSLSLVKVGNRILVVGITPDGMTLLTEISDEEEMQGIIANLPPEQISSKQGSFLEILRNAFRREEPTREEEEFAKIGIEVEKVRKQVEDLKHDSK